MKRLGLTVMIATGSLSTGCLFDPEVPRADDGTGDSGGASSGEGPGTTGDEGSDGPIATGDGSTGTPADPCDPNPCQNGGTCSVDGDDQAQCDCPDGYGGETCLDAPCDPDPCVNGTCDAGQCICDEGWDGDVCDEDIDDCAGDPCQNGGTCVDQVAGYECQCPAGFEGDDCEINIDDCTPNPCQNGGMCVDGIEDFTCSCPPGTQGRTCECVQGPPVQIDYTSMGTFQAPSLYDPPGVTVTGSAAINVLNLNGLGIVGGIFTNTIDGMEWIQFEFDSPSPAAQTSYFVNSAGNQNGDGFVGSAFVEAFDDAGASLGVVPVNGTGVFSMGTLFGPGLVSRFVVTADEDNHRIANVNVQLVECSP